MGEIAVSSFKWAIKLSYALGVVVMLIAFIAIAVSAITAALDGTILIDLLYFVQMWLPFNLIHMITWLFTSLTAYFAYRLSLIGYNILNTTLN